MNKYGKVQTTIYNTIDKIVLESFISDRKKNRTIIIFDSFKKFSALKFSKSVYNQ